MTALTIELAASPETFSWADRPCVQLQFAMLHQMILYLNIPDSVLLYSLSAKRQYCCKNYSKADSPEGEWVNHAKFVG